MNFKVDLTQDNEKYFPGVLKYTLDLLLIYSAIFWLLYHSY
jgi:hypothetical protein